MFKNDFQEYGSDLIGYGYGCLFKVMKMFNSDFYFVQVEFDIFVDGMDM